MKKRVVSCSIIVLGFLSFFSIAYADQPIVLNTGTLRAVITDVNTVFIDQQKYQLADTARISLQSHPEENVSLSPAHEGRRVLYIVDRDQKNNEVIIDLFILDQ